jgi:hypothetical protein
MHRSTFVISAASLVVSVLMPSTRVDAQLRRRAAGDSAGASPGTVRGTPRHARFPFAGVWDGAFSLSAGPRGGEQIPIVVLFDVTDSVRASYTGATILPNGTRAPHLATAVVNGEMRWKQQNSGGGFWMYTARLVSRDSIGGRVVLTDWPQQPRGEKPPAGTIALVRRPAGQ